MQHLTGFPRSHHICGCFKVQVSFVVWKYFCHFRLSVTSCFVYFVRCLFRKLLGYHTSFKIHTIHGRFWKSVPWMSVTWCHPICKGVTYAKFWKSIHTLIGTLVGSWNMPISCLFFFFSRILPPKAPQFLKLCGN